MTAAVLDQALYSIGEASRLLEIVPSKLRRWLDGAVVRGVAYAPVIRPASTGSGEVTWEIESVAAAEEGPYIHSVTQGGLARLAWRAGGTAHGSP